MKLWIIRNNGGTLELHQKEPSISQVTDKPVWVSGGFAGFIFNDLFPEVTFENPQEIEIQLVK